MRQSRREFMFMSAGTALLALGVNAGLPAGAFAASPGGVRVTPALPLPGKSGLYGLLEPEGKVVLNAKEVPGILPATGAPMLAYAASGKGGEFYNPILVLRKGHDLEATLRNGLHEPTIIHWHGVDGPWRQAGHPSYAVGPGESYEYSFSVTNRAGTYWYHPHPHMLTARQSYLGLASFFIVKDEEEDAFAKELDLRLGENDIPVVLQDKRFTPDGRLDYSPSMSDMLMGYLGEAVLANGAYQPTMSVATRLYRFRFLNGSTSRIYNLGFRHGGTPLPFHLIGNDGGFLPSSQILSEVFLAPGERVDVLIDLRALAPGQEVLLQNLPFDPMHNEMGGMMGGMMGGGHGSSGHGKMDEGHGSSGHGKMGEGDSYPIVRLMIERKETYDRRVPERLSSPLPPVAGSGSVRPVSLAMQHMGGWTINGLTFSMKDAPIVVTKRSREVWHIGNAAASMPHPMHLHGYFYRVVERRGSPSQVKRRVVDSQGRIASDLGFKDTVLVWPGETVLVEIDFGTPNYPGEQLFLFHCHNLEHEDQGMMLNVRVL